MHNIEKELLFKYFRNHASESEKQQIREWLEASPEVHRKEYREAFYLFQGIVLYGNSEQPKAATALRRTGVLRPYIRLITQAAAVILLFIGGSWLTHTLTLRKVSSQMTALEVPAGQRMKITMSDGSQVWLNAGTRIEYPAVFNRTERRIKLSGEAMFEVRHEQDYPFVVETFASEVTVLGTKFNVVADEQYHRFSTSLLNGSVKVVDRRTRETVYLRPNDRVKLINGRLVIDRIDDPVAMRWTEGLISLKDISFPELMTKFEKAYDVKIVIDRAVLPRIDFVSGKIRISDGIDHAMKVLQHVSDFTYTRNEETNTIYIE